MNRKQPPQPDSQPDTLDYMAGFIINAGRVSFTTGDGRKWQMRQPAPEEAADGDSAYRIAFNRTLDNPRLLDIAGGQAELKREAHKRGAGAEAVYLIPLLLLDERGNPVFDVQSQASLQEFEAMDPAVVAEMTMIYFGPLIEAINQAKKKSP